MENKKTIIIAIIIILTAVAAVRILSTEDGWTCKEGIWVKHGNPDSEQPVQECKS